MTSRVLPAYAAATLLPPPRQAAYVPPGWSAPLVPNFADWELGDVILVESDGSATSRSIQAMQWISLNAATHKGHIYTHAGLYVGDGHLIDATLADGIAERSVWDYCQSRPLIVRRISRLAAGDGAKIVATARTHLGKPYSWFGAVLSKLIPKTTPNPSQLFCSTFTGVSVEQATGINLAARFAYRPLYPGTLAEHGDLTDVPLEWLTV